MRFAGPGHPRPNASGQCRPSRVRAERGTGFPCRCAHRRGARQTVEQLVAVRWPLPQQEQKRRLAEALYTSTHAPGARAKAAARPRAAPVAVPVPAHNLCKTHMCLYGSTASHPAERIAVRGLDTSGARGRAGLVGASSRQRGQLHAHSLTNVARHAGASRAPSHRRSRGRRCSIRASQCVWQLRIASGTG